MVVVVKGFFLDFRKSLNGRQFAFTMIRANLVVTPTPIAPASRNFSYAQIPQT
jgi:hypothetical protein